jgi:hypothetical protein
MKMNNYKLPEPVLQAIMSYLVSRPYAEVANGIEMLKNLQKINEELPEPDEEAGGVGGE